MANTVNNNVLTATSPSITTGISLGQVLASKLLEATIVQEIFVDGRGCTEFIEPGAFSVRVAVQKSLGDGRDFSTAGSVYADAVLPENAEKVVDLKYVWDKPVDLPSVVFDASPVDIYLPTIRNIGKSIGAYSNKIVLGLIGADANNTEADGAAETAFKGISAALAGLEQGDAALGFDRFSTEDAVIVCSPAFYAKLLAENLVVFKDALDGRENAGFKGYYNGQIPVYVLNDTYFKLATGSRIATDVTTKGVAIVIGGNAIAKGKAPSREVITIQNPNGQGTRLLPLTRFGYAVVSPKGIQTTTLAQYLN